MVRSTSTPKSLFSDLLDYPSRGLRHSGDFLQLSGGFKGLDTGAVALQMEVREDVRRSDLQCRRKAWECLHGSSHSLVHRGLQ